MRDLQPYPVDNQMGHSTVPISVDVNVSVDKSHGVENDSLSTQVQSMMYNFQYHQNSHLPNVRNVQNRKSFGSLASVHSRSFTPTQCGGQIMDRFRAIEESSVDDSGNNNDGKQQYVMYDSPVEQNNRSRKRKRDEDDRYLPPKKNQRSNDNLFMSVPESPAYSYN